MEVEKDKKLQAFIDAEFDKWLKPIRFKKIYETKTEKEDVVILAYCAVEQALKEAFRQAILTREEYLTDAYFRPPEGTNIMSPNGNQDGYCGLELRLQVGQNYLKHQSEIVKRLWKHDKELAKKLEFD